MLTPNGKIKAINTMESRLEMLNKEVLSSNVIRPTTPIGLQHIIIYYTAGQGMDLTMSFPCTVYVPPTITGCSRKKLHKVYAPQLFRSQNRHQNLRRHRAVSTRQHGLLVLIFYAGIGRNVKSANKNMSNVYSEFLSENRVLVEDSPFLNFIEDIITARCIASRSCDRMSSVRL